MPISRYSYLRLLYAYAYLFCLPALILITYSVTLSSYALPRFRWLVRTLTTRYLRRAVARYTTGTVWVLCAD